MIDIAANIAAVQARITAAAHRAERPLNDITLVAVSKKHPVEAILAAHRAGLRHFGENRVAEGVEKIAAIAVDPPPVWHMIGHVQSRQVGDALGRFALIHSVDSLKLAERINRLAQRDNHPPVEILLECNVSGEAAKYGFALNGWGQDSARLKAFLADVRAMAALPLVTVRGLMTMAPWGQHPEESRPVFRSLAALQEVLRAEAPQLSWQHVSMGMTDDFEVAIEEGATMIRVGRAIFGERSGQ